MARSKLRGIWLLTYTYHYNGGVRGTSTHGDAFKDTQEDIARAEERKTDMIRHPDRYSNVHLNFYSWG